MKNLTYFQRKQNVILKKAKDYYENDKERLREQVRDKYRNLSAQKKKRKRYYNMSKEERQKLKAYQKNDH